MTYPSRRNSCGDKSSVGLTAIWKGRSTRQRAIMQARLRSQSSQTPDNTPPYDQAPTLVRTSLSANYRGGRWFESTAAHTLTTLPALLCLDEYPSDAFGCRPGFQIAESDRELFSLAIANDDPLWL